MRIGIESLHSHTTTSDGQATYLEVLDLCAKHSIRAVAFTDHDALPEVKIAEKLILLEHPMQRIIGIELSSGLPLELGDGVLSDFHIVGLGINPTDSPLRQYCQQAQEARVERMERMVGNLSNLGFEISEQDCLDESGGEAVGRPHVVSALKLATNEKNKVVFEDIKQRMATEAEHDPAVRQKYDEMISRGESQYPYYLFFDDTSFISGVYVPYLYWKDFDTSVSLIRNAEGLAFLAHYWTVRKKITSEILEGFLRDNRLDGVETVYGLWEYLNGHKDIKMIDDSRVLVKSLVEKHHRLVSGGADIHKRDQFAKFADSADWYAGETVGMAQNIIDQLGSGNQWHSI